MSIPTFFCNAGLVAGDTVVLSPDESHHAGRVRRLGRGDTVRVINGRGDFGEGEIAEISKHSDVEVILRIAGTEPEPVFNLEIASALPRGDRLKVMLDMLTQLGVSAFCPLDCARSETRFRQSMTQKWNKQVLESCKQSGRARRLEIDTGHPTPAEFALSRLAQGARVLVCDSRGRNYTREDGRAARAGRVAIMVGPEGGFTEQELAALTVMGEECHLLGLPGNILRIEAAAVSAAALYLA